MELIVKRLRDTAVMPTYGSTEASGFDLVCSEDILIKPGEKGMVPTGIALDIKKGYEVQIRPRSGISLKTPIHIANSPGTIDSDYTGEIFIIVQNLSYMTLDGDNNLIHPNNVIIKKGTKIAQGVMCPIVQAEIIEGDIEKKTERGSEGFGSTDSK